MPSLNGAQLKGIAMAAMVIDHLAAFVLFFWLRAAGIPAAGGWLLGYRILRAVGRLAFPLYSFLLAEGFSHTHDWRRYAVRLLAFGLISEIPYDLARYNRLFAWQGQNIFFTLAIGLATLALMRRNRRRPFLRALSLAGGCLLSLLLRAEYGMMGILLIAVFSLLREKPVGATLAAGIILIYETANIWCAGLAALLPIGCYRGERGTVRHPAFFYWFYPVHILLLFLFRRFYLGI